MDKAIDLAVTLALAAVLSGNLPWFIKKVRTAQIRLIQESKASHWEKGWIPPATDHEKLRSKKH